MYLFADHILHTYTIPTVYYNIIVEQKIMNSNEPKCFHHFIEDRV